MSERLSVALADRYRIERELGAGGMATVYLAQDLRHDRKVALKVLKPELAAVIGAKRFLAEIRTTANLQHPHILPLHDSGEVDGSVFYVMPYVDGESLRDRLQREKQVPIDDAIRIASEVAGAVHYAHSHGVIHRDIKPENILLHGGHALVADFGIALAASNTAGTRMTETGMSLGTPTYMSPEQAMGERDITARSDVYALGCVLYEMLLGEPPFTGPTAQAIVAKVLSERPAPLRQRRDRVPPAVEAAVLTALEKLPADRFESLAAFAAALHAPASVAHATQAPAATSSGRTRMVFAAGALAGVVATATIAWIRGASSVSDVSTASVLSQFTFNGRSILPAISPDGDFVAFVEQRCALDSERPCRQSLVVQPATTGRPVEVLRDVMQLQAPRWTADGQALLAVARLDSLRYSLFVVPRLGGLPNAIGPAGIFDAHPTADSAVVITQDARSGEQVARFIALSSGQVVDTVVLGRRIVHGVAWSPNGRFLALSQQFASVTIVTRDGVAIDSTPGGFRNTVRWTPDGRGVIVFDAKPVKEDDLIRIDVGRDGSLGVRTVLLSKVSAILRGDFDIARRSGRIVLVSGQLTIDLWTFEVNDRASARQRTNSTTWYGNPAISPDGNRLYYQRGDALGDNLYVMILPDLEEALTADRAGGLVNVHVSQDGRRVIFMQTGPTGVRLGEFDVGQRRPTYVEWGTRSGIVAPRAAGERALVYRSENGWNLMVADSLNAPGRPLLPNDSVWIGAFAPSPDGKDVAATLYTRDDAALGLISLADGKVRTLQRLDRNHSNGSVSWSDDGWIYLALTRSVDEPATLLRMRAGDTRLEEVMSLPPGCAAITSVVANRSPRGVCKRSDARGDIWLADLPSLRR